MTTIVIYRDITTNLRISARTTLPTSNVRRLSRTSFTNANRVKHTTDTDIRPLSNSRSRQTIGLLFTTMIRHHQIDKVANHSNAIFPRNTINRPLSTIGLLPNRLAIRVRNSVLTTRIRARIVMTGFPVSVTTGSILNNILLRPLGTDYPVRTTKSDHPR